MRALILAFFILCVPIHSWGQSKKVVYSIAAHYQGITRYDIVFSVQTRHHQITGGYYSSQLTTSSAGQINFSGPTFGYRYYPGMMSRKVNGFLAADYFGQSYHSSTYSNETTHFVFGGGVRYTPISRLYLEATIGFGPYRQEFSDTAVPIYVNQNKFTGVLRLGIAYRFN